MAFPSSTDSFSNPQGTTLVASDDHANQHRIAGSAIVAIENKLGLGAGTPTANAFLKGSGNGTSAWSSSLDNLTFGSPSVTGGTLANVQLIGTSQITGGTITNAALIGTSQITGGTASSITLGTPTLQGAVVNTTNIVDAAVTSRKVAPTFGYGTVSSFANSGTWADVTGGSVVLALLSASNVFISFTGDWFNGTATAKNSVQILRDSTSLQTQEGRVTTANAEMPFGLNCADMGLAAGTYTFKAQTSTTSGTMTISRARMIAFVFSQ